MAARSPARSSAGPLVTRRRDVELGGDDAGERGLADPGGPGEQEVVDRLATLTGGRQQDLEVLLEPGLADELVEPPRPQRRLLGHLGRLGRRVEHLLPHGLPSRRGVGSPGPRSASTVRERRAKRARPES